MPGESTKVTLSRPARAASPRRAPSLAAGFSSAGTQAAQASAIRCARCSRVSTSTPISAAGTRPKNDSAE